MSFDPDGRGRLPTEASLEQAQDLDRLSFAEAFDIFQVEDARIAEAVHAAKESIVQATERVTEALSAGGRLFYVGAGTSGRLGVLDAVECPPTFQSDPEQVTGILAGGQGAMFRSVEGVEDDAQAGARSIEERRVGPEDVVFGIAAGGTTPFVHGALRRAKENGAATVFFACVPFADAPDEADVSIRVVTGPEVLAGSTRLKAGTATKMVLNRISTMSMVALGKVYGNLMVDVSATSNAKLRARGLRILHTLSGLEMGAAEKALNEANGSVKLAVLMQARGLGFEDALKRLEAADGSLRNALDS